MSLIAPFPYMGSKRLIASEVWKALGPVEHYIEPFCGSCAVLLARPHPPRSETINDASGMIVNIWRSIKLRPEIVAQHADHPIMELDYYARHLARQARAEGLVGRLQSDPAWCDAELAGWDVWGLSLQIATDWVDPAWKKGRRPCAHKSGISRAGLGVQEIMERLSSRLKGVNVLCGDWERACGSVSALSGPLIGWGRKAGDGFARESLRVGVFLDPPYTPSLTRGGECVYGAGEGIAAFVRDWCLKWGERSDLRIVLAGLRGEHDALLDNGWRLATWEAHSGWARTGGQVQRAESIWLSPACLDEVEQTDLFGGAM